MSAETILYSALSQWPPLSAAVGVHVYPDEAPEGTPEPYIVFERAASQPTWTIHGELVAQQVSLTVSCFAATRLQADTIGDLATDAMEARGHISSQRAGIHDPETGSDACVLNFEVWEGTAN